MKDANITIRATDKTKTAVSSATNNLKGLSSMALKMGGALAAIGGAASFGNLIKEQVDFADKLQKLSIKLGASTEALSQYKHAADLADVSFDTFTGSLQKMGINIVKAADGTGPAVDSLNSLGLSAEKLKDTKPEDQFQIIADKLLEIDNAADRAAVMVGVFGKSGTQLAPMIDGLREARQEAEKFGLTITKEQSDNFAAVNDQLTRIGKLGDGAALALASIFAPSVLTSLETGTQWLLDAAQAVEEIRGEFKALSGDYDPSNIDQINDQIEITTDRINILQSVIEKGKTPVDTVTEYFGAPDRIRAAKDEIANYAEQLSKLDAELTKATKIKPTLSAVTPSAAGSTLKKSKEKIKATEKIKIKKGAGENDDMVEYYKKNQDAAKRFYEETRTPMEQYTAELERIKELQAGGFFENLGGDDTVIRLVDSMGESLKRAEEGLDEFGEKSLTTSEEFRDVWRYGFEEFSYGAGYALADVIMEQKNGADAMREVMRNVTSNIIAGLGQIAVKKLAIFALEKAGLVSTTAAAKLAGATTAASWASAAALTSLASFGGNAIPAQIGISSTVGLAKALSLTGVAHDGLSAIPTDGTYLLQKGEKLISNPDSKKLDALLNNNGGGSTVYINLNTIDSKSGTQFLKENASAIVEVIQKKMHEQARRGPAY